MPVIAETILAAAVFSILSGWEVVKALPALLAMRLRRPGKHRPVILLFSEFGDEVNGIARSTRELMHMLQKLGKDVLYLTPAHSTRNRLEWETAAIGVLPQAASVDTPGYPGVEMSFPSLRPLLRILRERQVTHVEILTPSLGCMLLAPIFRWCGPTLSFQYRTDVFAFGRHLGIPKFIMWLCHLSMGRFLKSSRSIGLPSAAYVEILAQRYPALRSRMTVLERGLPVRFDAWRKSVEAQRRAHVDKTSATPRRFFFLGRISKEKNLALLARIWNGAAGFRGIPLAFFGDGPFREELAGSLAGISAVTFEGQVSAEDLPGRLCGMDFLIFPSGTDTLGQAVLESLCMGIPALVSDQGGPAGLVAGKGNGFVLPMDDVEAWSACVRRCAAMGAEEYRGLSQGARRSAESLDPVAAAERHWEYWVSAGGR